MDKVERNLLTHHLCILMSIVNVVEIVICKQNGSHKETCPDLGGFSPRLNGIWRKILKYNLSLCEFMFNCMWQQFEHRQSKKACAVWSHKLLSWMKNKASSHWTVGKIFWICMLHIKRPWLQSLACISFCYMQSVCCKICFSACLFFEWVYIL